MSSPERPGSEVLSPVSRSEVSMPEWERDSEEWERQLQRELMLIQRQQQIQKQLLISEFQKQHQALLRQHQAQLQEHIKLQQALLTLRQQQEALSEERRPETEEEPEETRGDEQELSMKEHNHRKKDRSKEKIVIPGSYRTQHKEIGAMASSEVRQKLHDFLLSKSAKDSPPSGHSLNQHSKLWYLTSQHMSMEQNSPPLGETPPKFKSPLPSGLDPREDFPLRKTASEPNLKVRSRLKQKVSERRNGPMQRRRDGSVLVTPPKKRSLEPSDSSANDSSPSSGPSSPIGLCGNENGAPFRPNAAQLEKYLPQSGIMNADGSMALLNLYTSPSLPNLTLSLHSGPSPLGSASSIKEHAGELVNGQTVGTAPAVCRETKVSSSHQALLQHLLLKEQNRQQKMLSPGSVSVLSQSPLVMKERSGGGAGGGGGSARSRMPRHRPLNRTQSAPLPQSTLAQLVLQQQHHNFVEKQKQYHQQVHINQMLSQSIEQLRNPTAHLEEDEEGAPTLEPRAQEHTLPPAGVIRTHSSSRLENSMQTDEPLVQVGVIRVKEEPLEADNRMEGGREEGRKRDEGRKASEEQQKDAVLFQVKMERHVESMTETDV
ncbi:histone deacetylase 9-B [Hoplias malabaricus]|uniref:histone deacetylase 9-B n=1 Tax=Hoplias malabaricus TaxID=27720 RepID=UPI00346359BD